MRKFADEQEKEFWLERYRKYLEREERASAAIHADYDLREFQDRKNEDDG